MFSNHSIEIVRNKLNKYTTRNIFADRRSEIIFTDYRPELKGPKLKLFP